MNRLSNLGLIFSSPSRVARNIAEDPHWLIPLIVVVLVSFIATLATYKYQMEARRELVEEMMRDSDVDRDVDEMFQDTLARRLRDGAIAVGFTAIMILVFSAILNGVASLAGGKIGLRRMFAFYAYATMILSLGALIKIPLVVAKGSVDVRTSAAAFAPSVSAMSPLGTLLNSLDIFTIWMLVVLCAGYSALSGFSAKKSALIVVGLWALMIAILVGLTSLRKLATGS